MLRSASQSSVVTIMPPNNPKLSGLNNNHSFSLPRLQTGWGSVDPAGLCRARLQDCSTASPLGTTWDVSVPWGWPKGQGAKRKQRNPGRSHLCPHSTGRSSRCGQVHHQCAGKIRPSSRGRSGKAMGRKVCMQGWVDSWEQRSHLPHDVWESGGADADNPRVLLLMAARGQPLCPAHTHAST